MTQTLPNTPGFNIHLGIFFQTDRNGRKVAYRWSGIQMRAFRMSLTDAELYIAQGLATQLSGHPLRPAA